MGPDKPDFSAQLQFLVEKSVLDLIGSGKWLEVSYGDRVRLPKAELQKVYEALDMNRVRKLVVTQVEERLATAMINSMATELKTDVKKFLCDRGTRAELREVLRSKMKELSGVPTPVHVNVDTSKPLTDKGPKRFS